MLLLTDKSLSQVQKAERSVYNIPHANRQRPETHRAVVKQQQDNSADTDRERQEVRWVR